MSRTPEPSDTNVGESAPTPDTAIGEPLTASPQKRDVSRRSADFDSTGRPLVESKSVPVDEDGTPIEAPEEGLVAARWLDTNPAGVFNPEQGLIRYGDLIWVTAEQLEQGAHLEAWDHAWTADPAIVSAIDEFDNPVTADPGGDPIVED